MNGFLKKHLEAFVFEERVEEVSVVFPWFGINGENAISKGLKNVTKVGSLDVVVETLAQDVVHVDGVNSDQIVHVGKPGSSEVTRANFQYLSEKIMDARQIEE